MAGASKNSKKGSKPQIIMRPQKEKKVKEYILIELTKDTYKRFKEGQDLSEYVDEFGRSKKVEAIIKFYGKTYLKIKNI